MQKDKILKREKEQKRAAWLHQLFRSDPESSQRSLEDLHQEVLPSPRSPVFRCDDVGVNEHRGQEDLLPLQEPA